MSQYLEFFVEKNNTFTNVLSYGRSTYLYEAFENYVDSYTKPSLLDEQTLSSAKTTLEDFKRDYEERIAASREEMKFLANAVMDTKEKMTAAKECRELRISYEDEISYIDKALSTLNVINDLMETSCWDSGRIWVGIEANIKGEEI